MIHSNLVLKIKHLILLRVLPILLIAMALAGCNNQVFVDVPEISDGATIEIEGDGGVAVFEISTKHLMNITLGAYSVNAPFVHYYNSAGEEIPSDSPASEISRIMLDNDLVSIAVERKGAVFTVRSICNVQDEAFECKLRFQYDYGPREYSLEVLPGSPLIFAETIYEEEMKITDRADCKTRKETFRNDSPAAQTFIVYPYLNRRPSVIVIPDAGPSWANDVTVSMQVPVYMGDQWEIQHIDGIRIGYPNYYPGPDQMSEWGIPVPSYTTTIVTSDVWFTRAVAKGEMHFLNGILDRMIIVPFTAISLYPNELEITLEDEK